MCLPALLIACGSDLPTPEEHAQEMLDIVEARCARLKIEANQAYGQQALAEWDEAAASVTETISPKQEWEIRKSLGREMGLAPSEVNGWKEIYKARAEAARNNAGRVQTEIEKANAERDEVCGQIPKLEAELRTARSAPR
jgi:hypothetical protein